jgi:hypothetical protein
VVDVVGTVGGGWIIRRYDKRRRIAKEIIATAGVRKTPAVASRLLLTDHGLLGYELSMNLLNARQLPGDPPSANRP